MPPETWILVLHHWELEELPHFIDWFKLCPVCCFLSALLRRVQVASGGRLGASLGLESGTDSWGGE